MSSIEQNLSDMTEERTKYLETKKWGKKSQIYLNTEVIKQTLKQL